MEEISIGKGPLTVTMPDELRKVLAEIAAKESRSLTFLVVEAVREKYAAKPKRQKRGKQ